VDPRKEEESSKYKQMCNFTYCFLWVCNLISHRNGSIWFETVWEQGTEEIICT